ncbi:fibroblast growth factor receptor 2-like [Ptychodera flava]|uniref:fibroblast growth factor receptor 2-like n=1 Tax=Ptychodera flava TaxID=63121 RepID=UPI003969FF73
MMWLLLVVGNIFLTGTSSSRIRSSHNDDTDDKLIEETCIYKSPKVSSPSTLQANRSDAYYLYFDRKLMTAGGSKTEVAIEMSTIELNCPVRGNGSVTHRWMKSSEKGGEFLKDFQRIGNHPPVKDHNKLILEAIVKRDEGHYMCIVESGPCSINFTYNLIVFNKPFKPMVDKRYPQNKTVIEGTNVTFRCEVENSGPLQYTYWIKHHQPDNAKLHMKTLQDALPVTPTTNLSSFIEQLFSKKVMECIFEGDVEMTLYDVTLADSGLYTCFPVSLEGSDFNSAWLSVASAIQSTMTSVLQERSDSSKGRSKDLAVNVVIPLLILIIIATAATLLITKYIGRRRKQQRLRLTRSFANASNMYRLGSTGIAFDNTYDLPNGKRHPSYTHVYADHTKPSKNGDAWEFPRNRLQFGEVIGQGAFGKVVKAEASGIIPNEKKTTVAVKMLKVHSSDEDRRAMTAEMEYAKKLGKHINVISLLGCCTLGGPLLLLFEFACHGNLRDFLRLRRWTGHYENVPADASRQITHKDLISFSFQIARGMDFLASMKCIHRDLAARNILVADSHVAKIADFGLARDLHNDNYYKKHSKGRVPIKWMSPEALFDGIYTTKSDVWAFGVILWEIMTLGGTPYPSVTPEAMFDFLKSGKRMSCPKGCPTEIYHIMCRCWTSSPEGRPNFSDLVPQLDDLLSEASTEEYLALELPTTEHNVIDEDVAREGTALIVESNI